jgi:hypothetical protein
MMEYGEELPTDQQNIVVGSADAARGVARAQIARIRVSTLSVH